MIHNNSDSKEPNIDRMRLRVVSMGGLPTLPEVATKVLLLARDPASSMKDLSTIISNDPPLTGRILKVANSAFYGLSQQVGSLKVALVLLGMKNITNIVTSISIFRTMNFGKTSGLFSREAFWLHSAACGRVCALLEKELKIDLKGEGFVCGLIHDIGKIVLDAVFHEDFLEIINYASQEEIPMYAAEKRTLGISHATIGKWLVEKWNFPERISSAIEMHHDEPLSPEDFPLSSVLQLADVIVRKDNFGFCGFSPPPEIDEIEKWPILHDRTIVWEELSKKIQEEYKAVKEFVNIVK